MPLELLEGFVVMNLPCKARRKEKIRYLKRKEKNGIVV